MINFEFINPEYLWLLLIIPIFIIAHSITLKQTKKTAIPFANFEAVLKVEKNKGLGKPYFGRLKNYNFFLLFIRIFTLVFIILSIVGVIVSFDSTAVNKNYIFAVDVSSSMLLNDTLPTRFINAKETSINLINQLPIDSKVGVISFSGITKKEKELSKDLLISANIINNLSIQKMGGTDISGAIITASNMFQNTKELNSLILITDGSNTGSSLSEAIEYAKQENIIINTISIGEEIQNSSLIQINEESLIKISEETYGNYFKINNENKEIDYSKIINNNNFKRKENLSLYLLIISLLFLFSEWALINTKYKISP